MANMVRTVEMVESMELVKMVELFNFVYFFEFDVVVASEFDKCLFQRPHVPIKKSYLKLFKLHDWHTQSAVLRPLSGHFGSSVGYVVRQVRKKCQRQLVWHFFTESLCLIKMNIGLGIYLMHLIRPYLYRRMVRYAGTVTHLI